MSCQVMSTELTLIFRHGKGLYWTPFELLTQQKLWLRTYLNGTLIEESEIYTDEQRACRPPAHGEYYGTFIDDMGSTLLNLSGVRAGQVKGHFRSPRFSSPSLQAGDMKVISRMGNDTERDD